VPLILLTSSKKVMGSYVNSRFGAMVLWLAGLVVIALNLALLLDILRG
jgi:manganese transport protein